MPKQDLPFLSCPFSSSFLRSRLFPILFSIHMLLLLPSLTEDARAGDTKTLADFNITTHFGKISWPIQHNVAVGLFNPDPLLDIAIVEDGYVKVFQNVGNGYYSKLVEQEVFGDVESMYFQSQSGDSEPLPFNWGKLLIRHKGGGSQIVSFNQLLSQSHFVPVTQLIPSLNFMEEWRSPPQIQPTTYMAVADIDNDGRLEVAYSFFPQFGDSNYFVVYECVGNDSFVVEWDSLIVGGFGPYVISDLDNDGNKEIVLVRSGQVAILECFGPTQYRYYSTNIAYSAPPFKALESDVDHDGVKELCLLTSDPSPPSGQDATLIYVSEFGSKRPIANGWFMSFNIQLARYGGYTFEMAVGQVDGTGMDEIIPAGGSFGVNEPVPIDYLWYNGSTWIVRQIYTGLQSGTTAPMFVNLDNDSTLELFIGGVGPIGHGSCYALDY